MLALLERGLRHVAVGGRGSQIEDDVDRGVGEQLARLHRDQAVLLRQGSSAVAVEIRAGDDRESVERGRIRRVLTADDATSHQTHAGRDDHADTTPRSAVELGDRRCDCVESLPIRLVLLDDQPLGPCSRGHLGEPSVIDIARPERDVDRPAVLSHVLDVGERGLRACSLEQGKRIEARVPDPAEIELEEQRPTTGIQQPIEQGAAVVEQCQLAVVVVEPEAET